MGGGRPLGGGHSKYIKMYFIMLRCLTSRCHSGHARRRHSGGAAALTPPVPGTQSRGGWGVRSEGLLALLISPGRGRKVSSGPEASPPAYVWPAVPCQPGGVLEEVSGAGDSQSGSEGSFWAAEPDGTKRLSKKKTIKCDGEVVGLCFLTVWGRHIFFGLRHLCPAACPAPRTRCSQREISSTGTFTHAGARVLVFALVCVRLPPK